MIKKTAADGITSYRYDGVGRLAGVAYPSGETVGYEYDFFGNRTAQTVSLGERVAERTRYSYDPANKL
ncbi:MAG: RHS repeat protein, partial [Candidatus Methanofastidiosum sp.]|nr:RHS repeat protein [Methanofastidiosum sp.]